MQSSLAILLPPEFECGMVVATIKKVVVISPYTVQPHYSEPLKCGHIVLNLMFSCAHSLRLSWHAKIILYTIPRHHLLCHFQWWKHKPSEWQTYQLLVHRAICGACVESTEATWALHNQQVEQMNQHHTAPGNHTALCHLTQRRMHNSTWKQEQMQQKGKWKVIEEDPSTNYYLLKKKNFTMSSRKSWGNRVKKHNSNTQSPTFVWEQQL